MKIFSALDVKYSNYVSAVKSYLANKLIGWRGNLGPNTVLGQLITVVGNAISNVMLYIEDSLVEQNKFTAQRKKSIYGLAVQSGYQPSTGSASNVSLICTLLPTADASLNIIVPNHAKLTCTQNGMIYSLLLPKDNIIVNPASSLKNRYLSAVQGVFKTAEYVATGGKFYTQTISASGFIDISYITVKINDTEWERAASLYDMDAEGEQYCVQISYSGGVDIVFGNSKYGKALENGDKICVEYLSHDGENGNIDTETETYFVFNDALSDISGEDIDGNSVFSIVINDSAAVTAGSDSETSEQARMMIGYSTRSLVLASPENYKALINKYSFIGYNRTWSEDGSLVINTLALKNYAGILDSGTDYFSLSEADFLLTDSQKESVYSAIEESGCQLAGSTYQIIDPELKKYALFLYISLKSTYTGDKEYIKNQIKKLVGEFFMNIDNDQYIPKSDIINVIKNNIDEIDGINAYFLSEKNETAIQEGYYEETRHIWNADTGTYTTTSETVTVYTGENPNLGLDSHGNIKLSSDWEFPVLMGGWDWLNSENQEITVTDPLIIIFE